LSSAAPSAFHPDDATPYFSSGDAADAAAKLRLEEWPAAVKGFTAYVTQHPRAKDIHQAELLRAYAELKSGQFNLAALHFDALTHDYPLLADYHRLWGGARASAIGPRQRGVGAGPVGRRRLGPRR